MILSSRGAAKIWAWPYPTDLRKGYNGLYALVRDGVGRDPFSGEFFLFVNRRRNTSKTLFFDGTGLLILQKKLERGQFAPLWRPDSEGAIRLSSSEFNLYLEGAQMVGFQALSPVHVPLARGSAV